MFFAARLPLGTNVERCEIKSADCYTRDGARGGGIKQSPYLLAKCETMRASSSAPTKIHVFVLRNTVDPLCNEPPANRWISSSFFVFFCVCVRLCGENSAGAGFHLQLPAAL